MKSWRYRALPAASDMRALNCHSTIKHTPFSTAKGWISCLSGSMRPAINVLIAGALVKSRWLKAPNPSVTNRDPGFILVPMIEANLTIVKYEKL